ncbi:hypothetical protein C8J57DRAFT_1514573 [Mycena rebaudengoi]|nr:hypothetical protein C8J57DRAFT_1514573 [Mycena rebaudengoi]
MIQVFRVFIRGSLDWVLQRDRKLFDQYYALKPTNNEPATPTTPSTTVEPSPLHRYGSSFLLDAVKSARKDEQKISSIGGDDTLHIQPFAGWLETISPSKGQQLRPSALFPVEA